MYLNAYLNWFYHIVKTFNQWWEWKDKDKEELVVTFFSSSEWPTLSDVTEFIAAWILPSWLNDFYSRNQQLNLPSKARKRVVVNVIIDHAEGA